MLKNILRKIPGAVFLYRSLKLIRYLHKTDNLRYVYYPGALPGSYYSPLPDYKELFSKRQELFDHDTAECRGLNLGEQNQLEVLESFLNYYNDLPFPVQPTKNTRYYYENAMFSYADAILLYCIMRHYKPRRIIEIGSGFSSAAMLDVSDMFLGCETDFTFIEPAPERLSSLLRPGDIDECILFRDQVQSVPLDIFRELSANDVLFIDSSHVVKVGSDVRHILCNILPELKPGVLIHFHDIYWPFEYPEAWLLGGVAWNEAYFLHAFLLNNNVFEIVYFASFMAKRHADVLQAKMPLTLKVSPLSLTGAAPSSLWLKKLP